jgi:hypothetical protein
LYNKAIEYYSAINMMEEAQGYLSKVKAVFNDPEIESVI